MNMTRKQFLGSFIAGVAGLGAMAKGRAEGLDIDKLNDFKVHKHALTVQEVDKLVETRVGYTWTRDHNPNIGDMHLNDITGEHYVFTGEPNQWMKL